MIDRVYRLSKVGVCVGWIFILGIIGSCDVAVELRQDYPTIELIKGLSIGFSFMIPFIIFKVIEYLRED